MEITTENIIKMLPFDEAFKTNLLNGLPLLTQDQKHDIEDIIWDLYNEFYDLKLQENTHFALWRAKNGEETLDEDFYKRIEEKTEKDIFNNMAQTSQEVDLSAARKAMELIVKEIQAVKKN